MRFNPRVLNIRDSRQAWRELTLIGSDDAGVARMFDKARMLAVKVEGLKSPAANILKQEMLAIGGDCAVARGVVNCSAPISDALIMGTVKQVKKLVPRLKAQPFGLKTLAAEIASLLEAEKGKARWEIPGRVFDLEKKVLVMGIVNVTPDSFSDGGDLADREKALDAALRMVDEGADLIDVGGESTRPGAMPVSLDEETGRVIPVIEALANRTSAPISIDTYKSAVAKRAVEAGASIINDISGLGMDREMAGVAASTGAGLVLMHMRGTPRDMQTNTDYADLVGEIRRLLCQSAEKAIEAGVKKENIAIDPGIGFGKTAAGNLLLLRRLSEFTGLGFPILVGASRKSFIGRTLGIDDPKDRLEGSLAAAVMAVMGGARIIRAHDVAQTRRAVDMTHAALLAGAEE